MEIVGEFQGIDTDKGIWSYFRGHWLNGRGRGRPALRLTSLKLFPQIKSRTTFVRRGLERLQIYRVTSKSTNSNSKESWWFIRPNSSN